MPAYIVPLHLAFMDSLDSSFRGFGSSPNEWDASAHIIYLFPDLFLVNVFYLVHPVSISLLNLQVANVTTNAH